MIFDIEIQQPNQPCFKNTPTKAIFLYQKPEKWKYRHNSSKKWRYIALKSIWESEHTEQTNSASFYIWGKYILDKGPSIHPKMRTIAITRDGVYKLIKNIKPIKATGPDTIAGKVLKQNIEMCTEILTLIFYRSLETGKAPSDWNHANVTPAFKKGDKHNPC